MRHALLKKYKYRPSQCLGISQTSGAPLGDLYRYEGLTKVYEYKSEGFDCSI